MTGAGRLAPVLRAPIRLPAPLFGLLLGREWFIAARGTAAAAPPDLFSSVGRATTRRGAVPGVASR
ncbi:hypothetical protein [Streptomyces sp. NPDC046985]|uniref:hypothetical protein n=1 Tax=Streptomyces sp. NPDC046985 TaxID=3155377 RepID=UPI0033E6A1D1